MKFYISVMLICRGQNNNNFMYGAAAQSYWRKNSFLKEIIPAKEIEDGRDLLIVCRVVFQKNLC